MPRTNLTLLRFGVPLDTQGFGYDLASRLRSVTDGTNSAWYSYLANSRLVSQIAFTNGNAQRMVTTEQFDLLNRLTNIASVSLSSVVNFSYSYNSANQRTKRTDLDGSYWNYGFDALGQVTSGKRYWSDGSPVAGQQFEYSFDDIGNRISTKSGGDQFNGSYLRNANYSANNLNQYTSRDVAPYIDIFGTANSNATVSLWTSDGYWSQTTRHGSWYRGELSVNNSTGSLWLTITNLAVLPNGSNPDIVTNWTGNAFVPRSPQSFSYDLDGNLTNDGRFAIAWDAENRATSFTSLTSTPAASRVKVDCTYDSQWRRTEKIVSLWNQSTLNYQPSTTNHFIYDGWNLIAILDHTNGVLYSFTWGTDLSGTEQGAGGIGGLISMRVHSGPLAGTYFYVFDGNGNVMMLVNAVDGNIAAQYEYSPFGEMLRATGPLASMNPLRFSTKCQDDETGFVYYGKRYFSSRNGRWISRDPIAENGGQNIYGFIRNDPMNDTDRMGLCASCTCGPEVSRQVTRTLLEVDHAFWALTEKAKHKACNRLYDIIGIFFPSGGGVKAWDMEPLYTWGTSDTLVSFNGKCYNAGSVNYALWGRANCDCREAKNLYEWGGGFDQGEWTLNTARVWAWNYKILVQWDFSYRTVEAVDFTSYGYTYSLPPGSEVKDCTWDGRHYRLSKDFDWYWAPFKPRPEEN